MSEAVPLASVIVVCWNSAEVLGRCLDQLIGQDYPNYEIVVVDDGSDDDTLAIAEEKLVHGNVTVLRSPLNRGCPHARNLGLRHAKGEIIAFIDADGFADGSWLREIISVFEADSQIGGVASTVFLDGNPMVLNGAGGTVNRQGWGADLWMNVPYERAEITSDVLYPMGCGMAVRRQAVDRVGEFDDRMLNYYDDVDYGIRLWRAGYRVTVAPDAWIDHGFGHTGGDSARKQLLCEQHRIRVVLKHASALTLAQWAVHEMVATMRASWPRRSLKLKAIQWNARHLGSALLARWRLRGAPRPPGDLIHPSWGDAFPAGVPPLPTPRPEHAASVIDAGDPGSDDMLAYGWYPKEPSGGRSYRWAGIEAMAIISLERTARRLRLEYAHAPEDTGGVDVSIRRLGAADPLAAVWCTHLSWQYIERCVENHPLELPPGEYEVLFTSRRGWSDPPREIRSLGFALARMSFDEAYEIPSGALDMGSAEIGDQLVTGWFEPEQNEQRSYRWASGHAAAIMRLTEGVNSARFSFRPAPSATGGLRVSVRRLDAPRKAWSTRIAWLDTDWHEEVVPARLAAGDYLVSFDTDETWTNPGQRDPTFPPENRSLGFALSSLRFDANAERIA